MAELTDTERYAAAGIFALAVADVEHHQLCVPGAGGWTSRDSGLCEHVFRVLKLEGWAMEELLAVADKRDNIAHLTALISLLAAHDSEESGEEVKVADKLAETVDTLTAKTEKERAAKVERRRIASKLLEEKVTKELEESQKAKSATDVNETSGREERVKEGRTDVEGTAQPGDPVDEKIVIDDGKIVINDAETASVVATPHQEQVKDAMFQTEKQQNDTEKETKDTLSSKMRDVSVSGTFTSIPGTLKSKIRELRGSLKVAVLWELLSACIADLPAEVEGQSVLPPGYDARHRAALRLLSSWLDVSWSKMVSMEYMVAFAAMQAQIQKQTGGVGGGEVAPTTVPSKSTWAKWQKGVLIGGTAVAAGAILAITGGLAAPAIAAGLAALSPTMAAVPILGSAFASLATAAATTAGAAAVVGSFGAAGAGLGGYKMSRRVADLDEFKFLPLSVEEQKGENEGSREGSAAAGAAASPAEGSQEVARKNLLQGEGDTSPGQAPPNPKYSWAKKKGAVSEQSAHLAEEGVLGGGEEKQGGGGRSETGGERERDGEQGGSGSFSGSGGLGSFRRWGSSASKWSGMSAKKAADVDMRLRSGFRPRLSASIVVSGMVKSVSDYVQPWPDPEMDTESYALLYESALIIPLSTAVEDMLKNAVITTGVKQGAMLTVLSSLVVAVAWPLALISLTDMIDSTWSIAVDRSDKAGKLMAEILMQRTHGARLWQGVSSTVTAPTIGHWGWCNRTSFMTTGIAGIQEVPTPGIENIDVTSFVSGGHSSYRVHLWSILEQVDVDGVYPWYPTRTITKNGHGIASFSQNKQVVLS